jgi:hypothetical protein
LLSSSTFVPAAEPDAVEPPLVDAAETRPGQMDWRIVLAGVLIISAIYVWRRLGSGWIPFDEGTLAQSAERILLGQIPHRDFDELYTGGLAWVNAGAFRLLGTNLWTLRLVLFAVFVAWVPAVFYITSRFVRALAAGGVTLLAMVWSLPNYSAAMPSWYNLFLATFGVAALFRFLEVGTRRWLVIAGLAGALSILVKVVGLYYVAGVLLFLVFHAHTLSRSATGVDARPGRGYAAFVSVALLVFVAALWSVVRRQLHAAEFVQFFVPGALLAALLIRNEWTQPAGTSSARFAMLARLLIPFLAGVAVPVALFLAMYARVGGLGALVNGVFVVPMLRFNLVSIPALPLVTLLALIPFALLIVLASRARRPIARREAVLLGLALLLVLRATAGNAAMYRGMWYVVRGVLPVLAIIGVVLLSRIRDADSRAPLLRAQTMLLLAVTALCSLVQLPFSASIYFTYVAPLVVLMALAMYGYMKPVGIVAGLLVAFFAAFAVFRVNHTPIPSMGVAYAPPYQMTRLKLERGGIEIPRTHAMVYDSLVPMLRAHARGRYTWSSPDTPEIYFLSGLDNPTRTLFEVFDDSAHSNARVLRALDEHGVTAIVLNSTPGFSAPIGHPWFVQLAARYPHAQWVGPYQLRWRE